MLIIAEEIQPLMTWVLIFIDEKVTGGQLKVNLVVNKIPFISTNLDLCDVASMAGLSCPISAGQAVLKVSQQIPDEAPSVSINSVKGVVNGGGGGEGAEGAKAPPPPH